MARPEDKQKTSIRKHSCTYSWIRPPVDAHGKKRKGYDNSETTVGKLLVRRIKICFDILLPDPFLTSYFKIISQITFEQNYTKQIWLRLVEYSCHEVSGPS